MMMALRHRRYPGPGGMLVCSLLMHLTLIFVIVNFRLLPKPELAEETTYYVDVVSLPVAAPEKGSPAPVTPPPEKRAPESAPPAPPVRPAPSTMTLPAAKAKPLSPARRQAATPPAQKPAEAPGNGLSEAQEFKERLAKLERQAEERRQADVLARLRKGGKTGAPAGKGNESGSDYASFIHSRLKDAFASTIAYETKAPQMTVRLTIGVDGRITQYRVERSSGDKMFEDAVDRAVHLAERSFRRPPSGEPFEQGFVFRPQGVGVR